MLIKIPSLQRRGCRAEGEAGVVAHTIRFGVSDHPVCAFGADSPPLQGGEYRHQNLSKKQESTALLYKRKTQEAQKMVCLCFLSLFCAFCGPFPLRLDKAIDVAN